MKIVYGNTGFAVPTLKACIENFNVTAVLLSQINQEVEVKSLLTVRLKKKPLSII